MCLLLPSKQWNRVHIYTTCTTPHPPTQITCGPTHPPIIRFRCLAASLPKAHTHAVRALLVGLARKALAAARADPTTQGVWWSPEVSRLGCAITMVGPCVGGVALLNPSGARTSCHDVCVCVILLHVVNEGALTGSVRSVSHTMYVCMYTGASLLRTDAGKGGPETAGGLGVHGGCVPQSDG